MSKDSDQKADIPGPVKGFKILPHHVARNPHLSANAFRVWCVIRSHENQDGEAFPSLETICRESNLNRRTVQRAKKELIHLELLAVLSRPAAKGKSSCRYSTLSGKGQCQKCTSKDTHYIGSIPSQKWYAKMEIVHDCGGCGWCATCRNRDA